MNGKKPSEILELNPKLPDSVIAILSAVEAIRNSIFLGVDFADKLDSTLSIEVNMNGKKAKFLRKIAREQARKDRSYTRDINSIELPCTVSHSPFPFFMGSFTQTLIFIDPTVHSDRTRRAYQKMKKGENPWDAK